MKFYKATKEEQIKYLKNTHKMENTLKSSHIFQVSPTELNYLAFFEIEINIFKYLRILHLKSSVNFLTALKLKESSYYRNY